VMAASPLILSLLACLVAGTAAHDAARSKPSPFNLTCSEAFRSTNGQTSLIWYPCSESHP